LAAGTDHWVLHSKGVLQLDFLGPYKLEDGVIGIEALDRFNEPKGGTDYQCWEMFFLKRGTIISTTLVFVGLVLSFVLTGIGVGLYEKYGVTTPGVFAERALSPNTWRPNWGGIGEGIAVQTFVDWAFWFAVIWLIYFAVKKLSERLKQSR
jgi:hypothetical protein